MKPAIKQFAISTSLNWFFLVDLIIKLFNEPNSLIKSIIRAPESGLFTEIRFSELLGKHFLLIKIVSFHADPASKMEKSLSRKSKTIFHEAVLFGKIFL